MRQRDNTRRVKLEDLKARSDAARATWTTSKNFVENEPVTQYIPRKENNMTSQTPRKPSQPAGRSRMGLRPLPMRISQSSYDRLEQLRTLDDLTIQEHVRRAVDYYLEHAELVLALAASPQLPDAVQIVRNKHIERGGDMPAKSLLSRTVNDHIPRPFRSAAAKVGTR
jgi:hypothetical protein